MRFSALSRWWIGICALGVILAVASPAVAQPQPVPPTFGFFYKEIKKDGRIYGFNSPEEAARFEASGELGRAITKPGTGPNGETVVGDSERALQLFYFKHGLSEPVQDPPAPVQRIAWADGKTRI